MAVDARQGFFRNVFDALVEARTRQAQRQVNTFLLTLDDATLAANGWDRRALSRNAGASYPI